MYCLFRRAKTTETTDVGSRPFTTFKRSMFLSAVNESSLSYNTFSSNSDSLSSDYSELESFFLPFLTGFFFGTSFLRFYGPTFMFSFATKIEKKSLLTALRSITARLNENRTKFLKKIVRVVFTSEFYRLYFLSNSYISRVTRMLSTCSLSDSSHSFVLNIILQTPSIAIWRKMGCLM
jgi:hypothetical protein